MSVSCLGFLTRLLKHRWVKWVVKSHTVAAFFIVRASLKGSFTDLKYEQRKENPYEKQMKKIHPLWTNFCWKGYAQWSKQILKNERLEKKNFKRCFSYNNAVIQMSVNLIKADLQSSGLALGESFSFISDAFSFKWVKRWEFEYVEGFIGLQ